MIIDISVGIGDRSHNKYRNGNGYIMGSGSNVVTGNNNPISVVLYLYAMNGLQPPIYVTKTLSNNDGCFIFMYLNTDYTYMITTNINGLYKPIKIDNIIPSTLLNEAEQLDLHNKILKKDIKISDFGGISINLPYYEYVDDVTGFYGNESYSGFLEGVNDDGITEYDINLIFTNYNISKKVKSVYKIDNINLSDLKSIVYDGIPQEVTLDMVRGYISASVVITECFDSDFVIHCFRSSDKQFIGEYPIIDDRYTIDNLNLVSEYDIMLHDKNKIVETQVHSRRTPSIYQ